MTMTIEAPASCARRLRSAQTRGAEMGGRHDHRHAAGHVVEDRGGQRLALVVGEHELLGEVRQDAEAVRSGVDHEVDAALLAVEVQLAAVVEGGRAPPGRRPCVAVSSTGSWDLPRGCRGETGEPLRHAGGTRNDHVPHAPNGRRTMAHEGWSLKGGAVARPLTACFGRVRRTCATAGASRRRGGRLHLHGLHRARGPAAVPGALSADTQTDEEAFP